MMIVGQSNASSRFVAPPPRDPWPQAELVRCTGPRGYHVAVLGTVVFVGTGPQAALWIHWWAEYEKHYAPT